MTGYKLLLARLIFSGLFFMTGVYLVNVARQLIARARVWRARGVLAEGTIIGFDVRSPTNEPARVKLFAPIVTFVTAEGTHVRFTSSRSERPNPYTKGQQVTVRYLPEDPNGAELDAVSRSWMSLIVVVIMATVALAISALPFILPPPTPR
jgi:hypothetical protein